jgi:hypothetical protein
MSQAIFSGSPTQSALPSALPSVPEYWTRKRILVWGSVIAFISVLQYIPGIVRPMILWDDFEIVRRSWTWHDALANLWYPANEHSMPLGRITTWLMVSLAGKLSCVPYVIAWQGPLAVLWALLLVYKFVRREFDHPFAGLLAMGLYGVSAQYSEAVYWFSASFSVLALNMLLLGLLAAQRWCRTGRKRHLLWVTMWAALAPGWFAIGVLAGPLIVLYLVADRRTGLAWPGRDIAWRLLPLVGTVISLTVSLPQNAELLLNHQPHIGPGEGMHLDLLVGAGYSLRFFVDALFAGMVGIPPLDAPIYIVGVGVALLIAIAVLGWYCAEDRRLLVLGLGLIVLASWLPFSGRAYREYGEIFAWKRYRLLPHLGVVFYLCASLMPWLMRLGERLGTVKSRRIAVGALVLQVVLQAPQTLYPPIQDHGKQAREFEAVDGIETQCRAHHISGDQARQALPEIELTHCDREFNDKDIQGLDFVEGSPQPVERSLDEVRQLLQRP